MLACKTTYRAKNYINRSDLHWRIRRRQSWITSFCGGIDSAKGHKGGECCCARRIIIHRNAVESTTNHKGVDNGKNTMKGDGDGATWIGSGSEKTTHNPG